MFMPNLLPGNFMLCSTSIGHISRLFMRQIIITWMNERMNEDLMDFDLNTYTHVVHKIIHSLHVVHLKLQNQNTQYLVDQYNTPAA